MKTLNHSGGYNREATPVPIPNTEVKLAGVHNTWLETAREDRLLPDYMKLNYGNVVELLFCFRLFPSVFPALFGSVLSHSKKNETKL